MPYHLVVCDDNLIFLKLAKKQIQNIAKSCNFEIELDLFSSAHQCLTHIQSTPPDILFLDIEMPDINGIEFAKIIRQTHEKILLVFCSAHDDYVFSSFEVQPLRYIRKSEFNSMLQVTLEVAISIIDRQLPKLVSIPTISGIACVEHQKIMYAILIKRKLELHLEQGKVLITNLTIKAFQEILHHDNHFVLLHSGLLVNTIYISNLYKQIVTLTNNETFPVARTRLQNVKNTIILNNSHNNHIHTNKAP